MRIPGVGIWTLIYCQEATKREAHPTPAAPKTPVAAGWTMLLKKITPQEPKPNSSRPQELGEPWALSPRQLRRAQNRLKYEMNFEAQEWEKMNPVTEEPI